MDFTGARALRLAIEDFANLLRSKEAAQLDTQQTFSRAMVQAAEMQTARVAEQESKQAEAQKPKAQAESLEAAERAQAREAASQQLREAEERILVRDPPHRSPSKVAKLIAPSVRSNPSTEKPFCNCKSRSVPG